MLIGKDWRIEADSLNIILSHLRKRKSREGKYYEEWEIAGYFATVPNALKALINQEVKDTNLKDMKTITAKLDKLEHLIETLPQASTAIRRPS